MKKKSNREEKRAEIKEFITGAAIIFIAILILLALGYFEDNMFYIGVTVLLCVIAIVVAYFIGYHNRKNKKPLSNIIEDLK